MYITYANIISDYYTNRYKRVSPNDALLSFFNEYCNEDCNEDVDYLWDLEGYLEYKHGYGFSISSSPASWGHFLNKMTFGGWEYEYEEHDKNIDDYVLMMLYTDSIAYQDEYNLAKEFVKNQKRYSKKELQRVAEDYYKDDRHPDSDSWDDYERDMITIISHMPALDIQTLFLAI